MWKTIWTLPTFTAKEPCIWKLDTNDYQVIVSLNNSKFQNVLQFKIHDI